MHTFCTESIHSLTSVNYAHSLGSQQLRTVTHKLNQQTNKQTSMHSSHDSFTHSFVHSLSKFRLPSVPPAGEIQLYVPHSIIMHVVTENVVVRHNAMDPGWRPNPNPNPRLGSLGCQILDRVSQNSADPEMGQLYLRLGLSLGCLNYSWCDRRASPAVGGR